MYGRILTVPHKIILLKINVGAAVRHHQILKINHQPHNSTTNEQSLEHRQLTPFSDSLVHSTFKMATTADKVCTYRLEH